MGVLKVTLDIRCAPAALVESPAWLFVVAWPADCLEPALALTRLPRLAARLLAPPWAAAKVAALMRSLMLLGVALLSLSDVILARFLADDWWPWKRLYSFAATVAAFEVPLFADALEVVVELELVVVVAFACWL